MGLFDDLKKMSKEVMGELQNISKDVAEKVSEINEERRTELEKGKEIPEKYAEFPPFPKACKELSEKKEFKYQRCTMNFYGVTEEEIKEYRYQILSAGYVQNTNVRYDKENTYIILDYNESSQNLNLVFHIKK